MATLNAGSSTLVTLAAGNTLHVAGIAEVSIRTGIIEQGSSIGEYGPYDTSTTINIRAIGSVIYWSTEGDSDQAVQSSPPSEIWAFPFNSAGVQAAIDSIYSTGNPGRVMLSAVPHDIAADITMRPGVSIFGVLGLFDYSGYVPDENPTPTSGTVWNLAPGVTGIKYNNVDAANPAPAELADTAGTGIGIEGITFVGGLRGIHTGAKNKLGICFGRVANCRFFNQTAEHYILENFMHLEFGNLYAWNSLTGVAGGCVFRQSRLRDGGGTIALLPGNSTAFGTLFAWTNNFLGRGIEFQAIDGQMNEVSLAACRIQFNRHGVETVPYDIVLSATSGSANFLVADNAQFALCQVGMPLVIPTTGSTTAGIASGVVYFVSSRNAATNEITLNEVLYRTTSNIVASATTSATMKCGGFAGYIVAGDETGSISAANLGHIDIELRGNAVSAVFQRCDGEVDVLEVGGSATNTMFAARLCRVEVKHSAVNNITNDFSTLMGNFKVTNRCPATGGFNTSITLNSSHSGAHLRSTNGAGFNVTVPKELPAGFEFAFTCATANAGTLVQGSSVNIAKTAASLVSSNVVGATVRLKQIGINSAGMSYVATGDLT